ncbi:HAD family hydrolase [Thiocystis violacea]|uniref:HAD family hydrolase n=1 Tax=Thiocystis violacea TaxID=13725 RepID=UPI0019053E3C|nr:HAD-IA family hydrolase [Thiocystis violacea]MBK1722001.1 haloacid dehalogenase [Thiocystis violacea]
MAVCFCFDFDGTLVKSMDAAFNAFQRVGPELGCKPLTRDELLAMRGMHVREVIREMGIPFYRVPRLAKRMRKAMRAELMETPPVDGIAEVLEQLAARGHRIGVLSSNARDSVEEYAERYGLGGFSFVIGGAALLKKESALRQLLRHERLDPRQVLYVGDEVRDVEAARAAGVGAVAVDWGYNSGDRLALASPDYLIDHPKELLALTRFNEHQSEKPARL